MFGLSNILLLLVFSQYYDSTHILFLTFYWDYRRFFVKYLHTFGLLLTFLFNEFVCKTLALTGTFKYTVIQIPKGPDFIA